MSLHWMGDQVRIAGYPIKISRELSDALTEMLDAASTHDAGRIRAAIDKYEALSKEHATAQE